MIADGWNNGPRIDKGARWRRLTSAARGRGAESLSGASRRRSTALKAPMQFATE
jgi:hypothetical protein